MRSNTAALWKTAAPLFAALGNKTRLRLVLRLCEEGPLSIAALTNDSGMSRQAVTKHLRLLEDAGFVRATHQGMENVWGLEPRGFERLRQTLALLSREWGETTDRLKATAKN